MPNYTKQLLSLAWSLSAAIALLSLTTTNASAQATLSGCYVPASGTVYRIKADGLPDTCRSKNHVEFTWSLQGAPGATGQTGPAGPSGPQGPVGPAGGLVRAAVQVVQAGTAFLSPSSAGGATAQCPANMVATGGGTGSSVPALTVVNAMPAKTNDIVTGWTANFFNPHANIGQGQVFVVCVPSQ